MELFIHIRVQCQNVDKCDKISPDKVLALTQIMVAQLEVWNALLLSTYIVYIYCLPIKAFFMHRPYLTNFHQNYFLFLENICLLLKTQVKLLFSKEGMTSLVCHVPCVTFFLIGYSECSSTTAKEVLNFSFLPLSAH